MSRDYNCAVAVLRRAAAQYQHDSFGGADGADSSDDGRVVRKVWQLVRALERGNQSLPFRAALTDVYGLLNVEEA